MCTVSAISLGDGDFRIVCNRDERIDRPAALPPIIERFGRRRAILPIDAQSGGTWIAANDAGVAMVTLNVNPRVRLDPLDLHKRASRGSIIPSLLHCGSASEATQLARQTLDPFNFPPFRLFILDGRQWGEIYSDGLELRATLRPFDGTPLMFTSSSLGDDVVDSPRRALFDRMIRCSSATAARQDAFHAHRWPGRPHVSVMMNRHDACTVSRTIIDLRDRVPGLRYSLLSLLPLLPGDGRAERKREAVLATV